jgi:hypothetical protein
MSAESKKLTKKALHNMGSVNVLSALGTAGKAAGKWLSQPDNAALVVDTTMKVNKAIQDGKADGQAISEAGTKIEKQGQTRKSQRDIALGKIMKILGDEVILVSNIRKELLKEGIVTQEAQWEGVRNALAEKLYKIPPMPSTTNFFNKGLFATVRYKKAVLIFMITKIDNALKLGQTPTFSV